MMASNLASTDGKAYFYFITLMRALAAIVITNAHYTGIYPSDYIANGGLLGDVMFFSVSGFCLANPKLSFVKWYPKRLWRIYAVVWVITLVFVLLGVYHIGSFKDGVIAFLHPTYYHFVASITLLYIPLYIITKHIELTRRNYALLAIGLFVAQLLLYVFLYDKSYYHIDTVREPMIEFIFFQSMLLGLFFRREFVTNSLSEKNSHRRGQNIVLWIALVVVMGVYFASKLLFVKRVSLSEFQIANQVVLFIALILLFCCLRSLEERLKRLSVKKIWKVVVFLSDHTLEIYCVQYVLIEAVRNWGLPFPINWIVLTSLIIVSAAALRWVSQRLISLVKI